MPKRCQPSSSSSTEPKPHVDEVLSVLADFFHQHVPKGLEPVRVLVAVSGGSDSICLADALDSLHHDLGIHLSIAHLNHRLRGVAAVEDAAYVSQFAESRAIPCYLGEVDVRALAAESRQSIEVAARAARYRFLASCCATAGATHIALAHHADDQAETVLMRLLRGTGITGLKGMQPLSILKQESEGFQSEAVVIRPLLNIRRLDIEQYCIERKLSTRHDATNDEVQYMRNRIRHELLPILKTYNPGIAKVLVRLAETASTDLETIEYATNLTLNTLMRNTPNEPLALDRVSWRSLPVGLQRLVLRECIRRTRGSTTDLKFGGIEEARDVLNSATSHAEIAILASVRIRVAPSRFYFVIIGPAQTP